MKPPYFFRCCICLVIPKKFNLSKIFTENRPVVKNMVGSRVYVGGLPYGTRERDLEKFFKGYGRTRDILIKNGYGFVEFEDYRDADDAVYELNGKELLGER